MPPPDINPDGGPSPDADSDDAGPQDLDSGSDRVVLATGGGGLICTAGSARSAAPLLMIMLIFGLVLTVLRRR